MNGPLPIFGKYTVQHRLAIGGMGEVFYATHDGGPIILKSLLPDLAREARFVEQFLDEARVAARLRHPHVVGLHEVGVWNGTFFIAMEYIHGRDGAELLKRAQGLTMRLPVVVAMRIVADAALGLDHAHQARDDRSLPLNIVHRDISPQNLMVGENGITKVVDFGIAKASNRITRTATGVIKGKLPYMAPEQVTGQPLSPASDQFSLGLVLWELLAGRRAYVTELDADLIKLVADATIERISKHRPDVPRQLEDIIRRMLSKQPSKRYARCSEVTRDLEALLPSDDHQHVAAFMKSLGTDDIEKKTKPAVSGMPNMIISMAAATPKDAEVMATPRPVTTQPTGLTSGEGLRLMHEYLEQMPEGLRSYPDAVQKASVFSVFLDGVPTAPLLQLLPPELAHLVRRPPPATSWLSEVKATAIYLACAGLCFESESAYVDFAFQANRSLLDGPLYSMLFRAMGPRRIANNAAHRWATHHRGGLVLTLKDFHDRGSTFWLETPPNMVPDLIAQCYGTSARAAFEVAGAKEVVVDVQSRSAQCIELRCSWTSL